MRTETKAFWVAMALLALACAAVAYSGDHPFGEPGTERRKQMQDEVNVAIRNAHLYAAIWAKENSIAVPDQVPSAVLCASEKEVAEKTHCPASERGGRVVARSDINSGFIFLSRPNLHDIYHESYHVMFRSWDERNAESFAEWCLEMDGKLRDTKRKQQ
jgi:cellulase/cellobiase CelA1